MKQYASLSLTDMRYGGQLQGPDWPDSTHGTLDEHLKNGWSVISSAIRPGICGHESPQFMFLLERERPAGLDGETP